MTKNGKQDLSHQQLRFLARVAELMRDRFTGKVEIVFHQGGIRDFHESRRWLATELEEAGQQVKGL